MRQRSAYVFAGLLAVPLLIAAPRLLAADRPGESATMEDQASLELGRRVQAVQEAIQNPAAPGALQAITDLGHDQRYYVMVRGWLAYQRQGDKSIIDASRGQAPEHILARVRFLDQAIRAIDLE
ncbi:MAG TPA: hypothetical protein DCO71_02035 [Gammaproteobacteria bacterium]|nr:hypothetical protein [Gammaproteobacteria bacterium]